MNIFLDTNIILEYYFRRRYYDEVQQILDIAIQRDFSLGISLGSFYTVTYLIEDEIKKRGIHRPESISTLRIILNNLLNICRVYSISNAELHTGINDERFNDLEDSYQLQVAKNSKAQFLITINTKDFKNIDNDEIEILDPSTFLRQLTINN